MGGRGLEGVTSRGGTPPIGQLLLRHSLVVVVAGGGGGGWTGLLQRL